jgi:hypothetical protein
MTIRPLPLKWQRSERGTYFIIGALVILYLAIFVALFDPAVEGRRFRCARSLSRENLAAL